LFNSTITDLTTHIPYNCTIKLILTANKLWATNAPDKNGRYSFGISLKVLQIETFISENKSNMIKNSFSTDAFIDDEDEDDVVQVPAKQSAAPTPTTVKPTTTMKAVSGKTNDTNDDNSDDDTGDSDADSDSEETVVPQKVQTKTSVAKAPVKGKVAGKVKSSSS
jgi:hypothetical protein